MKPKLLLVEDDVFMIELLVQEFANAGQFAISIAKTGAEGVSKFMEIKPDVTLLDLVLPDEKGFEALRRIRRTPEGEHAKFIILSNLSEADDIEEAKQLGALDYLVKANTSLPEIVARAQKALTETG